MLSERLILRTEVVSDSAIFPYLKIGDVVFHPDIPTFHLHSKFLQKWLILPSWCRLNCNGTHGLDLQHKCFSLRCVFPPNVNYTHSKLQFQGVGGKHNEKISLITLAKNVGVPKKRHLGKWKGCFLVACQTDKDEEVTALWRGWLCTSLREKPSTSAENKCAELFCKM